MTRRLAETFDRMSLPILIVSLFLTGFLAYFLSGSLAFTTDLSSFAPETEADEAQERIEGVDRFVPASGIHQREAVSQ